MNSVEDNMKLVYFVYAKYFRGTDPNIKNDLEQEGMIGLIKSVNRFDENNGTAFSTYAARVIYNQMAMYLRKNKKHYICLNFSSLDNLNREFSETIPDDFEFERIDTKITCDCIINRILSTVKNDKHKRIIKLWLAGFNQIEISKIINIEQSQISRITKLFCQRVQECYKIQNEVFNEIDYAK